MRVRGDKISYIFIVESNFMHRNTNVSQGRELGQVEKMWLSLISIVIYCLQAASPADSVE